MNRCQKKWIFVGVITVFLFIYVYVSFTTDNTEGLTSSNIINLFPSPANMLPPTPRIKLSDTMSQTMPKSVTFSTPFPPNKPVGTMGQRA